MEMQAKSGMSHSIDNGFTPISKGVVKLARICIAAVKILFSILFSFQKVCPIDGVDNT